MHHKVSTIYVTGIELIFIYKGVLSKVFCIIKLTEEGH